MLDDAVRAVAELAASQHRAFTRRQAAELNFGRDRVATAKRLGWLDEPWPGRAGAHRVAHDLAPADDDDDAG